MERGEEGGAAEIWVDRGPLKKSVCRARWCADLPAPPQPYNPLPAPLPAALLSLHVIAIIIIHTFHIELELSFESYSTSKVSLC